ncbi:unnamed protein product [Bemisia tabaci]|uniref:MYND-type domain-containing protein n=1 Tax=Bemisia tabaci TaxID=7038 RepID=A0A9P0AFY9_BEMTA|nr:unnamed protein product [Bemisia tabaci]
MISSTVLLTKFFYYPLGNTPPNSLTQDLPPEQDADILLLGCGDARNILFTCFVDNARRIDVTCCDIEPGIQARNVLLYSLLIDDEANLNIDRIWNIYYHWSLDTESLELLETQIEKLLQFSESIDQWHSSAYGSAIRFCDGTSLSRVRDYWSNYSSRGHPPPKNEKRIGRMKAAIERAQSSRKERLKNGFDLSGMRSALPVIELDAVTNFAKVSEHWWKHGTVPLSADILRKTTHLNPAFLYSPTDVLTLHYGLSPLQGFSLSTAHTPISKGSAFHLPKGDLSSIDYVVECAKRHFTIWALSFRIAVANKLIIRIFTGDALAFCFALCSHKQSIAAGKKDNWFRTNSSSSIIDLHVDQGSKIKPAPVNFDVIDTSNIADHLGALNLMSLGSVLLKHHASSSLYTETLVQMHSSLVDRLSNILCSDVRAMPLFLGFVLPDLFTNATNSVEEDYLMGPILETISRNEMSATQSRSRLRWKRSRGFQGVNKSGSGHIEVEAAQLAKFLVAAHDAMFKYEDPNWLLSLQGARRNDPSAVLREIGMSGTYARYNRASFAFLLSALKANVVSDWNLCIDYVYRGVFSYNPLGSLMLNSAQDLGLNMHLFGVDNGRFEKPSLFQLRDAVLAPVLPLDKELVDQLCVTVRVSRKCLNKLMLSKKADEIGCPALVVSFEGPDEGWLNFFSAVQITFGTLRKEGDKANSCLYIEEDSSQLSGSSDLFASVYVPTTMLLQSKRSAPLAKVGFLLTAVNVRTFAKELGPNLTFASFEMTSKNVSITKYMPGTSALPNFTYVAKKEDKTPFNITTVRLADNGAKVTSLIKRVCLKDDAEAKAKLALKTSEVKIKFKSPFTAVISIAESKHFEILFPAPVSMSKYNLKIARKSSYIDVETSLLDPLEKEAANFMFPLFVSKVPSGLKIPMPWTAMRINLDALPPIDVQNKDSITWMNPLFSAMFSKREARTRASSAKNDVRTDLKDGLFSIFVQFAGLQGVKVPVFGLSTKDLGIQTLIFASNLRLDLANLSVVLDAAIIPLTYEMLFNDEQMKQFLDELNRSGLLCIVNVTETENVSWKVLLPAMVERCRASNTWKHSSRCEYLKAGHIPLPKGLREVGKSSVCSCGIGKCFPPDFLKDVKKKFSEFDTILSRYATRAAVGPVFAVPYVESTLNILEDLESLQVADAEMCHNCGQSGTVNSRTGLPNQVLKNCSKCGLAKYCSRECQKADWKKHKPFCKSR